MSRGTAAVQIAAALALLIYCASNLRIGTDLSHFMPDTNRSELAQISSHLTDSPFTRTMVLSIESDELAVSIAAAGELASALRDEPEVAWLRSGLDATQLEDLYKLFFPHRLSFLSDQPERDIPVMFETEALREKARRLKADLASPASGLLTRIAPEDPISSFRALVDRFRRGDDVLKIIDGQLVTRDERFAIAMLGTHASAFESGPQALLLAKIQKRFESIRARLGANLKLEMSGANRFAVAAEQSIKSDVYLIGACSFIGVATLFFAFIGGWRAFLVVSVPPLVGILVATAVGLASFGSLDGITMAFGASLMGIAIDYSNHVLIHNRLGPAGETPSETTRRIRPSLMLGAITTVASLGGLAMTSFPAFREMSFFASLGVMAALWASLVPLRALLPFAPQLPARSAATAAWLGRHFSRLERAPRVLLCTPLAVLPLAMFSLPRLEWNDDMSKLTSFPEELIEQDKRVRQRVSSVDTSRFAIGLAADEKSAVALSDQIHERLVAAAQAGEIDGDRSLHDLLWSEELQSRNWRAVKGATDLYERLDAAFVAEGFRSGAFRAFGDAIAGPPPTPLALSDLANSALGDLLAPYSFRLGDDVAVVTYLDGIHQPEVLRARLAGLERVFLLDQSTFVNDIYSEFRTSTLRQIVIGGVLVFAILVARYRAWRPTLAAFLPAAIVATLLLSIFALAGVRANLLHAMSLIMVMGMGVDYGVFLADSAADRASIGATMLSLLMSCLTTVFVFGTLAISSQPALRAIGVTTGLGVLLSYALAPVVLAMLRPGRPLPGAGLRGE